MRSASGENAGSTPQTGDLPALSFGFVPAERRDEARVLRDITLLYLSLDAEPGPYGSIPHARTEDHDGRERPA